MGPIVARVRLALLSVVLGTVLSFGLVAPAHAGVGPGISDCTNSGYSGVTGVTHDFPGIGMLHFKIYVAGVKKTTQVYARINGKALDMRTVPSSGGSAEYTLARTSGGTVTWKVAAGGDTICTDSVYIPDPHEA
jgi:hypothetical protein